MPVWQGRDKSGWGRREDCHYGAGSDEQSQPSGKSEGRGGRGRHTLARNESVSEPGKARREGAPGTPLGGHPLGIGAGQEEQGEGSQI